jgi:spore coat protein U-like protein
MSINQFKRKSALLGVAVACVLGASAAQAATTGGTLTVTAAVAKVCNVSNASLPFGTYNPGGGNVDVTAQIGVRCTKSTGFTVALGGGGSGSIAARQMASTGTPAEKLDYQLYTTSGYTTVFGDGTTGSTVAGTGAGMGVPQTQNVGVYGRLFDNANNQGAAVLTDYTDSVAITVTY